jgi:hypothetical protein
MYLLPWYIGTMTDPEFIDAVTGGQLAPAAFDHRAHHFTLPDRIGAHHG